MNLIVLLILVWARGTIESPVLVHRRACPNAELCHCDWESRLLECSLVDNMTTTTQSFFVNGFNLRNRSLLEFDQIRLNNLAYLNQSFFAHSNFSFGFRLTINSIRHVAKRSFYNLTGMKILEISHVDLRQIEPASFDHMSCKQMIINALDKNFPINLNTFGSHVSIDLLQLNFNGLLFTRKVFLNGNLEWLSLALKKKFNSNYINTHIDVNINLGADLDVMFSRDELINHWSINAQVKKLYIKDARGIDLLDHSWAPKFHSLERVEIYYSDIKRISRNFGLLHRKGLKYLAIRNARIEYTEARSFADLVDLEYLDLSANPIKQISPETFYGLGSLRTLVLHAMSDTYILDDYDICMLTYLPCRVDVYLDSYDGLTDNMCALIYLHQLRNDSSRFRSLASTNYIRSLSDNEIVYHRDAKCKLKERFIACLEASKRTEHCLFDTFISINETDLSPPTSTMKTSTSSEEIIDTNDQEEKEEVTTQKAEELKYGKNLNESSSVNKAHNLYATSSNQDLDESSSPPPNQMAIGLIVASLLILCTFQIALAVAIAYMLMKSRQVERVGVVNRTAGDDNDSTIKSITKKPTVSFLQGSSINE